MDDVRSFNGEHESAQMEQFLSRRGYAPRRSLQIALDDILLTRK